MNLQVKRMTLTNKSTIGELYVDGVFECFTLEDVVRPVKIHGMTAISAGVYQLDITFSARFKRLLPELRHVPNFEGVRIHPGNTDADTEGCILVGQSKGKDFIGSSRAAFNKLFPRMEAARAHGKMFIEVVDAPPAQRNAGALDALDHPGLRSLAAPVARAKTRPRGRRRRPA